MNSLKDCHQPFLYTINSRGNIDHPTTTITMVLPQCINVTAYINPFVKKNSAYTFKEQKVVLSQFLGQLLASRCFVYFKVLRILLFK